MTIRTDISGVIVDDDVLEVYEWLGYTATSPRKIRDILANAKGEDIDVTINSGGGDVLAGNEIYALLKNYEGDVNINILFAASAASVVAMARHSVAEPTAMLMIHNSSSVARGDYHEMERMSETLKTVNSAMSNAYRLKTGMSEEELLALMDKETWLDANRALELGFIDEIKGTEKMAASEFGMLSDAEIKATRKAIAKEKAEARLKKLKEEQ